MQFSSIRRRRSTTDDRRQTGTLHRLALTVLAVCLASASVLAQEGARNGEWRNYGGDSGSTKYSSLSQINASNVKQLKVAWTWDSPDNRLEQARPELKQFIFESTPLMVGGRLYTSTSLSQVISLDASTGTTLWVHDPKSYESGLPPNLGYVSRGLAYWEAGEEKRLFFGTGDAYLIALDAETGHLVPGFGDSGRIDLTQGLRREVKRKLYSVTSPPIVCRDVVVVGSSIRDLPEGQEMPPGDVRGFDARSGELLWIFHSIPLLGEYGNESWEDDSWKLAGNTNVWTLMSADEELSYLYLPFSAPTNDMYGGHRLGDNLFSNSLVCLDVRTGRRIWHFQTVHHDLWDYDLPAAPNLVDLTVEGTPVKAVAQLTKQGFCFVFDRTDGRPLWPIEERPVPSSNLPGERASPTQPFPLKPAAYERQGMTIDDLVDFTPELRQEASQILKKFTYGPLYTPPHHRPTVNMPGQNGGANWAGAGFDPETGILYVPSITEPYFLAVSRSDSDLTYAPKVRYATELQFVPSPDAPLLLPRNRELPLFKPPYSRLTAIDLNQGEPVWSRALGEGPRRHPLLRELDLPLLGSGGRGPVLVTKTLLFVAEGISTARGVAVATGAPIPLCGGVEEFQSKGWLDSWVAWFFDEKPSNLCGNEPMLRALDKASGDLIWETRLPHFAGGAPMTYLFEGKQYLVIAVGGFGEPSQLVAFRLP